MYNVSLKKLVLVTAFLFFTQSCTVYTEKRSEALSQAVYATSEGIKNARLDKAYEYSEQAKRLAYAPKNLIPVPQYHTKEIKKITAINSSITPVQASSNNKVKPLDKQVINSNVIYTTNNNDETETVLRLVVPDFLKDAKILIENSNEWNELLKTKEFKEFLEKDNERLEKLKSDIDAELKKQLEYSNKMVLDLNNLQKLVLKKDLLIIRLYIVIGLLIGAIGGGVYLRMKGVL